MHNPNNFYFAMFKNEPEDILIDGMTYVFLFISKEFWDAGEGLDCVDEPRYLYDKLREMFGDETDAIMENTWHFGNLDPHQVKRDLLEAGFVENNELTEHHKDMCGIE